MGAAISFGKAGCTARCGASGQQRNAVVWKVVKGRDV